MATSKTFQNGKIVKNETQITSESQYSLDLPDKVPGVLVQARGVGPAERGGEDHVVEGADVVMSPWREACHHLVHEDSQGPPVDTAVIP